MVSFFGGDTIGIDLGSQFTRIITRDKGVILEEPTMIAINTETEEIIAFGEDASYLIGKTNSSIDSVFPFARGKIYDFHFMEMLLSYFIKKSRGVLSFIKPDIVVSVSCSLSKIEKRAIEETLLRAGAKRVFLVRKPICAALGAQKMIDLPEGIMIVDIGAGTTDAAIVSYGGIVSNSSNDSGTLDMIKLIKDYVKDKHTIQSSHESIEGLFKTIGSALFLEDPTVFELRGVDTISNLPKTVDIQSDEITHAIEPVLKQIIDVVKKSMFEIPPELSSDILEKGMIICGGGAHLSNISELLFRRIGVRVDVLDDPLRVVSYGLLHIISHMQDFIQILTEKQKF